MRRFSHFLFPAFTCPLKPLLVDLPLTVLATGVGPSGGGSTVSVGVGLGPGLDWLGDGPGLVFEGLGLGLVVDGLGLGLVVDGLGPGLVVDELGLGPGLVVDAVGLGLVVDAVGLGLEVDGVGRGQVESSSATPVGAGAPTPQPREPSSCASNAQSLSLTSSSAHTVYCVWPWAELNNLKVKVPSSADPVVDSMCLRSAVPSSCHPCEPPVGGGVAVDSQFLADWVGWFSGALLGDVSFMDASLSSNASESFGPFA
jgi:hypothetical protein